ncbi:hypothetical protein JAO73_22050 [Hymenobacter sp. BT523]|uniref:hypothetical protein n=1 Tax=Hymenobacter sp. BT523 TaxID=2795725 RepID=UPI0018EAA7E8|nr:hypothetical protein [Hymenobacter sp. BT523]MBJ6111721.1 hypothetical protein [Hymenobacter sp. BT523]
MLQKGRWIGQYTFSNQVYNEMRGFEHTAFTIDIDDSSGNSFAGRVQDDLTTGGTEGIGEIIGKVNGDVVEFVKQMPIMTLLFSDSGESRTYNRKHNNIYYSGRLSENGKSISGSWKFKFSIIWIGFIPYFSKAVGGTWNMQLVEE